MSIPAFQKLTPAETAEVVVLVHERCASVTFKFSDSGVFRVKAAPKGWGQNILAPRPGALSDLRRDQLVTGNFLVKGQMYFFNAKLRLQKKQIHLELIGDLQQLIRRKHERFFVSESLSFHMMTKRIDEKLFFHRGNLQDISSRGCKVAFITAHADVKIDAVIVGSLRFGTRKPIDVSGIVRYQRRLSEGRFDQVFGVEFLSVEDPNRLAAWIIDVQREMFAELKPE